MIQRRTVVRGAVWTAPVLAVAAAAPAFAASTDPILVVIRACKSAPNGQAGVATYSLDLEVTNNLSVPLTFQNVTITSPAGFAANPINGSTVPGGSTSLFGFSFTGPTGQGNPVVTVQIDYYINGDSSVIHKMTQTYTLNYNQKGCSVV